MSQVWSHALQSPNALTAQSTAWATGPVGLGVGASVGYRVGLPVGAAVGFRVSQASAPIHECLPSGHSWHTGELTWSENWPGGHFRQTGSIGGIAHSRR